MTVKCSGRKHTPEDLAYMAGIVDGEGFICVNSYCPRKNHNGIKQYNLRIGVINTNYNLLLWIKDEFGGTLSSHGRVRDTEKHKPSFSWCLSSAKAVLFLEELYPYLKVKKPQADVAFKFRETFDLSKYIRYENGVHVGNKIPADLWEKRMQCRDELMLLNKRGPQ